MPAVLGVPADAIRDERVPLTELWGASGRDLVDRLAGVTDPAAAAAHLEQACAERMADGGRLLPAAPRLRHRLGTGRALDVRELGASERQLRRTCTAAFGYGPRTLRRILRFRSVVELLAGPTSPVTLAGIAQRAGYADQAHLTREVGAFSGLTPVGLRRALAGTAS